MYLLHNEKVGKFALGIKGEHLCRGYAELAFTCATVSYFFHHDADVIIAAYVAESLAMCGCDNVI